jgi:hypothetical protein
VVKINWDDFKDFKQMSHKNDNFEILLEFIKSYYNMNNPVDMFESLSADELAKMMLEKRDIKDAEDLENFLFKLP